jgi:DNA-binding SARP family transcriptional activator
MTRLRDASAADRVEFQVLGAVEVYRGGTLVPVAGRTAIVILAGLLLSANQVVPADAMFEWRWGSRLPASPRAAVQSGVSRLRKLIGDDVLETAPMGYRLVVSDAQLDLLRFSEHVAAASRAAESGAAAHALASLDAAIALWRGTPLRNVNSPALQREAVPRLTETYLRAAEQRAELCLRLGRNARVAQDLSGLVVRHPFHERLAGQLMIALVRGGRQADALAVYDRLRQALAGTLGIDPSAALKNLHTRILRADPGWETEAGQPQPEWLLAFLAAQPA